MNLFTIVTLFTSIAFYILGNVIWLNNRGSRPHRIYAWAFYLAGTLILTVFLFTRAETLNEAWLWIRLSAIMHFLSLLTLLAVLCLIPAYQKWPVWKKMIIYLPFVLLFVQDFFFPGLTYGTPVKTDLGWLNTFVTDSVFYSLDSFFYIVFIVTLLVLIIHVLVSTKDKSIKRFALFFLYTFFPPFITAYVIMFLLPEVKTIIFRFEVIGAFMAVIITIFGMKFRNIFNFSIEIVSKDIVEHMSNFLILTDQNFQVVDVNQNMEKVFGYSRTEVLSKNLSELIEDTFQPEIITDDGSVGGIEIKMKSKQEVYIPVIVTLSRVVIKGEFLGYIIIGSDIRNLERLQTEKKIIEMELKALVSQMNPHFLFNALNSIQHFLIHDFKKANQYLSNLATLLRKILENSNKALISLKEEINILKLYLDIESLRFGNEFEYKFDIQESEYIFDNEIPPMLIQPFVENAIWHGLRTSDSVNKRLIIQVEELTCDILRVIISDNGIGINNSKNLNKKIEKNVSSHSIQNIKERIRLINKQAGFNKIILTICDLANEQSKGTKVELTFIDYPILNRKNL
jgi:PAS domain S-box-containing protein